MNTFTVDPQARADAVLPGQQPLLGTYLDLARCPHCGIDRPNLQQTGGGVLAHQGGRQQFWSIYICQRCGGGVLAGGSAHGAAAESIYPQPEVVSNEIPERARSLLVDALAALHAPSVCIMGAGSAVDAMLKAKGYKDGSLYKRIDQAAEAHLITAEVAAWAHEVRLRANDERHADDEAPLPSTADARRVVDFAIALGEILYVLPARVAAGRKTTQAGESGSIPIAVPLTLPEPHEKIADGQQPSRKLRARVWVGGTSLEATMSLKATARAVRSMLESEGWEASVISAPLSGRVRKELIGIEVHSSDESLTKDVIYMLAAQGYHDARPIIEPVPRIPHEQHDLEVWIGDLRPQQGT